MNSVKYREYEGEDADDVITEVYINGELVVKFDDNYHNDTRAQGEGFLKGVIATFKALSLDLTVLEPEYPDFDS